MWIIYTDGSIKLYGEQIFRRARIPFFRAPSISDHLRANNGELPGGVWPEKPSDGQVSTHLRGNREKGECLSVRNSLQSVRVSRMGGAGMLLYLLSPISTPSHLLTRGSAIPSVSINHAIHHLTSTAWLHSWSSAAELFYLGHVMLQTHAPSRTNTWRTGLGGISAKPSPGSSFG